MDLNEGDRPNRSKEPHSLAEEGQEITLVKREDRKISEKRRKAKMTKGPNCRELSAKFQKAVRKDRDDYIEGVCMDIE